MKCPTSNDEEGHFILVINRKDTPRQWVQAMSSHIK